MTAQLNIFGEPEAIRSFETDGYGFLIAYAKRNKGQPFSSEDVTLAAMEAGLQPVDLRRWGAIFAQAARDGYIRRPDQGGWFRRSFGNGTVARGWVGV